MTYKCPRLQLLQLRLAMKTIRDLIRQPKRLLEQASLDANKRDDDGSRDRKLRDRSVCTDDGGVEELVYAPCV